MSRFNNIFGEISYDNSTLDNTIQDFVVPEAKTPRGVHRLANGISVTFPSVEKDVHIEDFILIETLRLFHPDVYQKIQENKSKLFEFIDYTDDENSRPQDNTIEDIILGEESKAGRSKLSRLLNHIFPFLAGNPRNSDSLKREKRVCSESHFDTYFRFTVSSDAISHEEFSEFVENAGNIEFIERKLVKDSSEAYNESKIESLFNEIDNRMESLSIEDIGQFIISLYSVADRIHTSPNFSNSPNRSRGSRSRIVDLSFRSLRQFGDSDQVSEIIFKICDNAPLNLLLELCGEVFRRPRYFSVLHRRRISWNPMTKEDMIEFAGIVLNRIEGHLSSNFVFDFGNFYKFIDNWRIISPDGEKIEDTFHDILEHSPENVIAVAKGLCVSFPNPDANKSRSRMEMGLICRHINVEHLLTKLFLVSMDSSIGERERGIVKRGFTMLNEYH